MRLNENQYLERILESAIIVSWADLMSSTQSGLIQIEYGFAPSGTLDYLKVWASVTRGHWLLACAYWMSPSTFHDTGRTGAYSEFRDATPESVRASDESWPARIASDSSAYARRQHSSGAIGKRGLRAHRIPTPQPALV